MALSKSDVDVYKGFSTNMLRNTDKSEHEMTGTLVLPEIVSRVV